MIAQLHQEYREYGTIVSFFVIVVALALLFFPGARVLATTVGTNVSITGTVTVGGHSTIGNATSTDILYLNSRVASSIIPTVNNAIDLGEYARAYNDIFASGTAHLGTVSTTNNFSVNGNTTIGNGTSDILTVTARLNADLDPSSNNAVDLGQYGLAYKDIIASGTIMAASTTFFHTTATATVYVKSGLAGKGGTLILEDSDGAGCSALTILNGTVGAATVTCPE